VIIRYHKNPILSAGGEATPLTTNNPLSIDSVGQDLLLIATFEVKTDI